MNLCSRSEKPSGSASYKVRILQSRGSGKLPSQIIVNPRENASGITLHSGKEFEVPKAIADFEEEKTKEKIKTPNVFCNLSIPVTTKPLPFLPRNYKSSRKDEQEKEILEIFRKVEVNIHILDEIK